MKTQEPLRFYDSSYLSTMSKELLSSYLPSGKDAQYTRMILGLPSYQTQVYGQYTDPQQILVLKHCIATMCGITEAIGDENAKKDARIKQLESENLSLRQENESIRNKCNENLQKCQSELHEVKTELEKLRRREKKRMANSETSSLPPSQNPISEKARIKKNQVSLREKSNKPNGGQVGHKGGTLKRMDDVQEKILLYPDKELRAGSEDTSDVICPNCGKPISRALFKEAEVHQIIDIADKIKAIVKDMVKMEAICPNCGMKVSGTFGSYAQGNVNYGPRLQALVTLLYVRHSVSINRTSELISDLYGIKLNEGTIVNMVQRQTEYSRSEWYSLRYDVCDSNNGCNEVHADETHAGYLFIKNEKQEDAETETRQGSSNTERIEDDVSQPPDKNKSDGQVSDKTSNDRKIDTKQLWLWTFLNRRSVFMMESLSRQSELVVKIFGESLSNKILITDRYAGYFTDEISVRGHQICLVHLLRNIKGKMEIYPKLEWLKTLYKTIQMLIHRYNQQEDRTALYDEYKQTIHDLLHAETSKDELPDQLAVKEIDNFKNEICKREDSILTFLLVKGVLPNNTAAEVALRPTKTKLKVSGCFRKEYGAYMYAINESIAQTALLNKQNVFQKMVGIACKANVVEKLAPWDRELLPKNLKCEIGKERV